MSHSADSFRSHFSFSAFVYTHIHTTYTNGNDLKLNLTDAFRTDGFSIANLPSAN